MPMIATCQGYQCSALQQMELQQVADQCYIGYSCANTTGWASCWAFN
jgi:hypothetical protein